MQRRPAGASHVGQATEDICRGVRSFFFIPKWSDKTGIKTVQFWTPIRANPGMKDLMSGNRVNQDLAKSNAGFLLPVR